MNEKAAFYIIYASQGKLLLSHPAIYPVMRRIWNEDAGVALVPVRDP